VLKILITITLFFMCINFTYAGDVFSPFIVDSDDKEVCDLALNHYTELFKSKSNGTKGLNDSQNVSTPKFISRQIANVRGDIKTAEADFYGSKKLFVYHGRSHSWRGDIYTGYIINPDQIEALESQLKENKKDGFLPFYPMGSLAYGPDYSWWENLPFKYQNKWYVLADFGDFYRHDSKRHVYQILDDGSSRNVCTIQVFQNFDAGKLGDKFPFFTAYKKSVEEMMLSDGGCGTSHPEVTARWNGQYFASMAIVRPWAITPTWKSTENIWEARRIEFQKKHFEDWKFQDVWSYREHATFENLKFDAISELKNHYITNYSYSEVDALKHASGIINSMPGRYYSLGVYYDEDKDFSIFQRMVEGTYENWTGLKQDLRLNYGSVPFVALSLMIDNPQQYKKLPPETHQDSVKSFYNKDILMFAAHMNNFDSVKYLIDSGWPVDNVTSYEPKYSCDSRFERLNRSALTYAAENASIEVIKLLVEAGSDTKIKDSKGNSLDYYIGLNPRFSAEEKELGFDGILKVFSDIKKAKPSFSCKEKLNRIEAAICNSAGLSIYDRELNKNYRNALVKNEISTDLKASQINWIKRRNNECGAFSENDKLTACLARTTRSRIRYLEYIQSAFSKHIN